MGGYFRKFKNIRSMAPSCWLLIRSGLKMYYDKIIGPRTINEINSSLPSIDIKIKKEQVDCLNLKK